MRLSLTPFLLVAEFGFLFIVASRAARSAPGQRMMRPVYAYLLWLTGYGVVAVVLGARGAYVSDALLPTLPGLWLPVVPVVVAVVPVVVFGSVRTGLRCIVDVTPWHWFAYFHTLRIAALGSAYKTMIGEFPAFFEYAVGIPDLLFGLSAVWIAGKAKRGEIGARDFLAWNLIGVLVIVPSTPILLQLGLPGPLQLFTRLPDARAVFAHPMSIAPMVGVPLFVLVNLCVAWRLWERSRGTGRGTISLAASSSLP